MKSTQKILFIVMLLLLACFRGSNRQDRQWLSPHYAFEFLAENEAYFEHVPGDIVNSYFSHTFDTILQRRSHRTHQWLFSSSRELEKQQMALLDELSGSMDGSDISAEYEREILRIFEHYLENWIEMLKEHGQ